jgi:hypothetical protein
VELEAVDEGSISLHTNGYANDDVGMQLIQSSRRVAESWRRDGPVIVRALQRLHRGSSVSQSCKEVSGQSCEIPVQMTYCCNNSRVSPREMETPPKEKSVEGSTPIDMRNTERASDAHSDAD